MALEAVAAEKVANLVRHVDVEAEVAAARVAVETALLGACRDAVEAGAAGLSSVVPRMGLNSSVAAALLKTRGDVVERVVDNADDDDTIVWSRLGMRKPARSGASAMYSAHFRSESRGLAARKSLNAFMLGLSSTMA
jgi:hypothetical protein